MAAPSIRPVNGAAYGVSGSGYIASELPLAPGYGNGEAWDLNDAQVVVGKSYQSQCCWTDRATKWVNGQPILLALYPNQTQSRALAINSAGKIVGEAELTSSADVRAVVWTGSTVSALPFVGYHAGAEDINDAGVIVGWEGDRAGIRAVKWVDGGRVNLHPPTSYASQAFGVNSAGDVVGIYKATQSDEEVPIVWKADGSWFTLPSPTGGIECFGLDVNQSLAVVGACTLAGSAFAWTPLTGMRDLGWGYASWAYAVSSRHRAVGAGPGPVAGQALTQHQTILDTLPNPAGSSATSYATGVNACGSVVGVFRKQPNPNTSTYHPVLWTKPTCDPVIGPS